jgi:hypothetical protein
MLMFFARLGIALSTTDTMVKPMLSFRPQKAIPIHPINSFGGKRHGTQQ